MMIILFLQEKLLKMHKMLFRIVDYDIFFMRALTMEIHDRAHFQYLPTIQKCRSLQERSVIFIFVCYSCMLYHYLSNSQNRLFSLFISDIYCTFCYLYIIFAKNELQCMYEYCMQIFTLATFSVILCIARRKYMKCSDMYDELFRPRLISSLRPSAYTT